MGSILGYPNFGKLPCFPIGQMDFAREEGVRNRNVFKGIARDSFGSWAIQLNPIVGIGIEQVCTLSYATPIMRRGLARTPALRKSCGEEFVEASGKFIAPFGSQRGLRISHTKRCLTEKEARHSSLNWTACTVHHQFWSACSRLSQHLSDPLGMLRSKPQVTLGVRKVIALPSSGLKRLLGLTHQSAASSLSFSGSIGHHLVQVEQTFLEVLSVPVLSKSQCPAQAHVLQCRQDYRRVSEVKPAGTRRSLGLGPEKQAALSEMGHGAAGPIRDQHYCPTRGRRGARFASRSTAGRVLGRTAAIRVARILANAPMAPGRMTAELMG